MTLLLSPHNDDESIFAAYVICGYEPAVVTVLRSYVQEARGLPITFAAREGENRLALHTLAPRVVPKWVQWPYPDTDPAWTQIRAELVRLSARHETVFAPCPEPAGGHAHHDRIGELALDVWGPDRVTLYSTYTNAGRSTRGARVEPEPDWVMRKLRALACYETQIAEPSCRPHFTRGLDEYLLPGTEL